MLSWARIFCPRPHRELLEETGYGRSMAMRDGRGRYGQNPGIGIYVLTGECPVGQPRPSAEGGLEWVSFFEPVQINGGGNLPIFLNRIQKMQRGDPPFSPALFIMGKKLTVEFTN